MQNSTTSITPAAMETWNIFVIGEKPSLIIINDAGSAQKIINTL